MVVGCALVFEVRRREGDLGHMFHDAVQFCIFKNVFIVVVVAASLVQ